MTNPTQTATRMTIPVFVFITLPKMTRHSAFGKRTQCYVRQLPAGAFAFAVLTSAAAAAAAFKSGSVISTSAVFFKLSR